MALTLMPLRSTVGRLLVGAVFVGGMVLAVLTSNIFGADVNRASINAVEGGIISPAVRIVGDWEIEVALPGDTQPRRLEVQPPNVVTVTDERIANPAICHDIRAFSARVLAHCG